MGICASCLRGLTGDDDERTQIDETSPLLNDQRDYDKDAQMRQRENELNQIVNETNENLIDISSFFNPNASFSELTLKKSVTTLNKEHQAQKQDEEASTTTPMAAKPKLITTNNLTQEEKNALTKSQKEIAAMIEQDCKIVKKGPLVVDF